MIQSHIERIAIHIRNTIQWNHLGVIKCVIDVHCDGVSYSHSNSRWTSTAQQFYCPLLPHTNKTGENKAIVSDIAGGLQRAFG